MEPLKQCSPRRMRRAVRRCRQLQDESPVGVSTPRARLRHGACWARKTTGYSSCWRAAKRARGNDSASPKQCLKTPVHPHASARKRTRPKLYYERCCPYGGSMEDTRFVIARHQSLRVSRCGPLGPLAPSPVSAHFFSLALELLDVSLTHHLHKLLHCRLWLPIVQSSIQPPIATNNGDASQPSCL